MNRQLKTERMNERAGKKEIRVEKCDSSNIWNIHKWTKNEAHMQTKLGLTKC